MGSDSHNGTSPPETPSRCSGFFLFYHDLPTNTYGYYNSGFFLLDHDQPTNTCGYYIYGFDFSPTKT